MKNRNGIYKINELEPGDRFYFRGNATKDIYEIREIINNGAQVVSVKQPCLKEQEERYPWVYQKTSKGLAEVIYLRNNPESRYI